MNVVSFGRTQTVRAVTDAFRADGIATAANEVPLLGMTRHIVISDTDDEARALAAQAYRRWFDTLTHLERKRNLALTPKLPASFEEAAASGECVAGSASTVRSILRRQVREAGINYLLCQVAFGDLPLNASLQAINAIKAEIMPAFECSNQKAYSLAQSPAPEQQSRSAGNRGAGN